MTALATNQTPEALFQEQMKARLRASLGDLMPDAVLSGIVAKGIHEAFFTPQQGTGYYDRDKQFPSWMTTFLQAECRSQVAQAVEKWVRDHPEKITQILEQSLSRNIAATIVNAFTSILTSPFEEFRGSITATLSNLATR